jgi:L-2,4-diaminobutyric acid acetyltransferase
MNGHSREEGLAVRIRKPKPEDGSAIWQLVQGSELVGDHPSNAHLLLTSHFANTCLVAHLADRVVAFVGAYRPPPSHSKTVFVWQIRVDAALRRHGLATALLQTLIRSPGCEGVEYLEAAVGSSNAASKRLFERFARDLDAPCDVMTGISSKLFSPVEHESQDLMRIGPIDLNNIKDAKRTHRKSTP